MSGSRAPVLAGGIRTPFSRARSDLASLSLADLGRFVLRELVERTGIDPFDLDLVVTACSAAPADAAGLARAVALDAQLPGRVPTFALGGDETVALEALAGAALRVRAGDADLVAIVAVGSGSRTAPVPDGATAWPAGNVGEILENAARALAVTREEQDGFAAESHRRASSAWDAGLLSEEVVAVPVPPAFERFLERDDSVRPGCSADDLAGIAPRFLPEHGTVTSGNAAQDADGAVALLLASRQRASELDLPALAGIRAWGRRGCEPPLEGLAAVTAVPAALKRAGLADLDGLDLIEWDERYAAAVLASVRACASRRFCEERLGRGPLGEIGPDRLNVHGGSIASGHPSAAAGARQVLRLALELARREAALGMVTVSAVAGQGAALILDRSAA